jgi:hypothetical protein
MARSALVTTDVVVVELLLPPVWSVVDDETVAVFVIGFGVEYEDGTAYVVVMVAVAPAATVPSEHGYAVVHAPVLETKVSPVGVASETMAVAAGSPPTFVTVTV